MNTRWIFLITHCLQLINWDVLLAYLQWAISIDCSQKLQIESLVLHYTWLEKKSKRKLNVHNIPMKSQDITLSSAMNTNFNQLWNLWAINSWIIVDWTLAVYMPQCFRHAKCLKRGSYFSKSILYQQGIWVLIRPWHFTFFCHLELVIITFKMMCIWLRKQT